MVWWLADWFWRTYTEFTSDQECFIRWRCVGLTKHLRWSLVILALLGEKIMNCYILTTLIKKIKTKSALSKLKYFYLFEKPHGHACIFLIFRKKLPYCIPLNFFSRMFSGQMITGQIYDHPDTNTWLWVVYNTWPSLNRLFLKIWFVCIGRI